jgi:inosine-uridine nucleoside N-ribohydrolase
MSSTRVPWGVSRKLLLDVDTGCDDAVMIALALAASDLEVVGITTVAGNTTVENATRNTLGVLELLDRTDVPVARGAPGPVVDDLHTAEYVHGPDGIRGDLPEPTTDPVDAHAVEFTVETAREHGEDLTVVAVGPPTNLGTALVVEPDLGGIVDEVYVMGGAGAEAGNVTAAAEANFHNDPVAARRVVETATPRVAGLDALNRATVPQSLIDEYRAADPPLSAVGAWLDYPETVRSTGPTDEPIVHDAAVVADLVADVLSYEPAALRVDTSEGPSRGALLWDRYDVTETADNAHLAVDIDTERYRSVLRESVESL